MDEKGTQEVDAILRVLKPWGRFQIFQLFICLINIIPASFVILSPVITGYIPDYECKTPSETSNDTSLYTSNLTYITHQCQYDVYNKKDNSTTFVESITCDDYVFSNEQSYAYEWNLVCSKTNLAALAQSLALGGQGIGAFIMSHLADRYGRKPIHVISNVAIMITMAIMAASPNVYVLLVLRLVGGTFQQGVICTSKILSMEWLPKEIRSHTTSFGNFCWTSGILLLALLGYLFQDIHWRYLQLTISAFSIYTLSEFWLLDESVRWLLSNGRINDARRILRKAARWNNVDYVKVEEVLQDSIKLMDTVPLDQDRKYIAGGDTDKPDQTVTPSVETYTVVDILKNPALRINTFILWYAWVVITGTYYGLTLVSTHLAGDRFFNFFLSGLIELPSVIANLYLLNKIGRKKTLMLWQSTACMSLIISTVALTVFGGNNIANIISTVSSMIGKCAITGAFSTVFQYTPEIYPTNYRNSGLGISSSISRIGGILAPFASNLALIALWIPGAIFASMCLVSVILITKLPESAEHELPTTIMELNTWDKEEKH